MGGVRTLRTLRLFAVVVALAAMFSTAQAVPSSQAQVTEHRYRISAKIRLLLFWIGNDDVGGARAVWRSGADGREIALLIGSNPDRAPRGVNEWGFVREQVQGDSASVFGVRTSSDDDSPTAARAAIDDRDRLVTFDAMCSQVGVHDVSTALATITGALSLDYTRVDPLLDMLTAHSSWSLREMKRPADTAPGFLTALDRLMTTLAASARAGGGTTRRHALYVYKDATYDLSIDRVEPLSELRLTDRTISNLRRASFRIRHVRLGTITRFEVIFGTEGDMAGVPVQATYQPHWWFKIRLDLDEHADVPSPNDEELRRRVDETCTRATAAARHHGPVTTNGGRFR
jgi:hypothetical protein